MTFASSVQSGLIFDVRYVIMFFGMLFGGFLTGAILLVEFLIYRLYIGGSGMIDAIIILIFTFRCPFYCHSCTIEPNTNFGSFYSRYQLLYSPAHDTLHKQT